MHSFTRHNIIHITSKIPYKQDTLHQRRTCRAQHHHQQHLLKQHNDEVGCQNYCSKHNETALKTNGKAGERYLLRWQHNHKVLSSNFKDTWCSWWRNDATRKGQCTNDSMHDYKELLVSKLWRMFSQLTMAYKWRAGGSFYFCS